MVVQPHLLTPTVTDCQQERHSVVCCFFFFLELNYDQEPTILISLTVWKCDVFTSGDEKSLICEAGSCRLMQAFSVMLNLRKAEKGEGKKATDSQIFVLNNQIQIHNAP